MTYVSEDILRAIFEYLYNEDLLNIALSSRTLSAIALPLISPSNINPPNTTPYYHRILASNDFDHLITPNMFEHSAPLIQTIMKRPRDHISPDAAHALFTNTTNLHEILGYDKHPNIHRAIINATTITSKFIKPIITYKAIKAPQAADVCDALAAKCKFRIINIGTLIETADTSQLSRLLPYITPEPSLYNCLLLMPSPDPQKIAILIDHFKPRSMREFPVLTMNNHIVAEIVLARCPNISKREVDEYISSLMNI